VVIEMASRRPGIIELGARRSPGEESIKSVRGEASAEDHTSDHTNRLNIAVTCIGQDGSRKRHFLRTHLV
jgi:hypothetical protein